MFENKYKFSIHDVLRLQKDDDYRGVFHFSNHPVTSVWIMGDVVSSFAKDTFTSFKGMKIIDKVIIIVLIIVLYTYLQLKIKITRFNQVASDVLRHVMSA